MSFYRRYRPSKSEARAFAEKMAEIEVFCREHDIIQSFSGDSYYFVLNSIPYRVSNHTVAQSDASRFDDFGNEWRPSYHEFRDEDTVDIYASKKRIIEIYTALENGLHLDGRGRVIE